MANDEWRTPIEFYNNLNEYVGGFDIDLCASEDYHLCELYYTKEDSSLNHEWIGKCFCNPPYSNIKPFLSKAIRESYRTKCEVWFLIPQNFEQFHHELIFEHAKWIEAIYFIKGRLSFLDENMESQGSARPSNMLVYYKFDNASLKLHTSIDFYTCERDFTDIKKVS